MQTRDEMILRDICKELGKIRAELHTINLYLNENKNKINNSNEEKQDDLK